MGKSDIKYKRIWALLNTHTHTYKYCNHFCGGNCRIYHPSMLSLPSWPLSYHLVCEVEMTFFHWNTITFLLRAYVKSQIRSYRHKLSMYSWERLGTFPRGLLVAVVT